MKSKAHEVLERLSIPRANASKNTRKPSKAETHSRKAKKKATLSADFVQRATALAKRVNSLVAGVDFDLFAVKPLQKRLQGSKAGDHRMHDEGLQIWIRAIDRQEVVDYDEQHYLHRMSASFDLIDLDSDGVVLSTELTYSRLGWNTVLAEEVFGKEECFQKLVDPDDLGTVTQAAFMKVMKQESEEAECLVFPCVLGAIFCCRLERFEEAFTLLTAFHNTPRFWPLLARTCASSRLLHLCIADTLQLGSQQVLGHLQNEDSTEGGHASPAGNAEVSRLQALLESERAIWQRSSTELTMQHATVVADLQARVKNLTEQNRMPNSNIVGIQAIETMKEILREAVRGAALHVMRQNLQKQVEEQCLRSYERQLQQMQEKLDTADSQRRQLEEDKQVLEEALEELGASSRNQLRLLHEEVEGWRLKCMHGNERISRRSGRLAQTGMVGRVKMDRSPAATQQQQRAYEKEVVGRSFIDIKHRVASLSRALQHADLGADSHMRELERLVLSVAGNNSDSSAPSTTGSRPWR